MNIQPTCSKCGVDLTVDNMRALPDGKGFVCKNCYDVGGPRLTKTGFADISPRREQLREPSRESQDTFGEEKLLGSPDSFFDLKEYICHECGYSFKKNPEFAVKVCPYCGKRDTVHQKIESSADEYIV